MTAAPRTAPTIDWDHNAPTPLADFRAQLDFLANEQPVSWNTAHGGFWVLAGYAETSAAYTDWETFSSMHDGVAGDAFAHHDVGQYPEGRTPRNGLSIPQQPARFVPTEADGEMHTQIRRLEAPFFTPKAVRSHEDFIRQHTVEAIEAVAHTGRIDFAADMADVIPVKMASQLIGQGSPDWRTLTETVNKMLLHPISSPLFPMEAFLSMQAQILDLCRRRASEPRDDVASALVQGTVFGESVTPEQAQTILNGLTFGSTDTTATTFLHSIQWLAHHPDVRTQLRQDPALIPQAIEEFLRIFTPGPGVARTVTRDVEFFGYDFREGERVLVLNGAGNRDARKFPDPLAVDFDRAGVRDHLAFGAGPHRCLGAPIARLELRIMFEEVLTRLPDFDVVDDEVVEYPVKSGTMGFVSVPATFTPVDAAA